VKYDKSRKNPSRKTPQRIIKLFLNQYRQTSRPNFFLSLKFYLQIAKPKQNIPHGNFGSPSHRCPSNNTGQSLPFSRIFYASQQNLRRYNEIARRYSNSEIEKINEIDQRSDVITVQARKLGFWIIGASNYWLIPDASVLPPWKTHKKYIINRENKNYEGGAKSDRLDQVQNHRKWIEDWAKQNKVPIFDSIAEAAKFLSNK